MNYLRSFFLNFLAVFFIVGVGPGIEVGQYAHVPNIGADILFSGLVGFLNASIFPFLFILEVKPTPIKMTILSFFISFIPFLILANVSLGIHVNALGVTVGTLFVWAAGSFTNYLEWRQDIQS